MCTLLLGAQEEWSAVEVWPDSSRDTHRGKDTESRQRRECVWRTTTSAFCSVTSRAIAKRWPRGGSAPFRKGDGRLPATCGCGGQSAGAAVGAAEKRGTWENRVRCTAKPRNQRSVQQAQQSCSVARSVVSWSTASVRPKLKRCDRRVLSLLRLCLVRLSAIAKPGK